MLRLSRTSPATVTAVLLAAALVTFTAVMQAGVRGELERAVRTATGDADVIVTATGPDSALPPHLSAEIRALPGVEAVEEHVSGIEVVDDELGAAIGVQSLGDDTLLHLTGGRLPTGDNEAVIVEVPGMFPQYLPGAEVTLKNDGGEAETIAVVGTVKAEPGATDQPSLPTLLCSRADAQRLLGREGSTSVFVHASGDVGLVEDRVAEIAAGLGDAVSVENSSDFVAANASRYEVGTRTVMLALQLLTLVAMLAAFVVVGTNYRLQLARSTRQIALLRSIGALRRQVFTSALLRAAATGALGAAGGIVLGVSIGAAVLPGTPAAFTHVGFWLRLVALGLAAGILPSALAALQPAWKATRVAPVEALRSAEPAVQSAQSGDGPYRRGRVRTACAVLLITAGAAVTAAGGSAAALTLVVLGAFLTFVGLVGAAGSIFPRLALGLERLTCGIGGVYSEVAGEQLRHHPGRSGATAVAVWLGSASIAALLTGSATAQATLSEVVDGATPADIIATPTGGTYSPVSLHNRVSQLPEVAGSAIVTTTMLDADSAASPDGSGPMTVTAWSSQLESALRTGTAIAEPEPGTVILPPTPQTTAGGAGPGTVTLRQAGTTRRLEVRVVEGAPLMGIVHQSDLAPFERTPPTVWVRLAPGADPLRAMETIARVPGVATLSSPAVQRQEADAELARFVELGLAFLAVALIIAVVGLSNTVALSVTERAREIGVLRALGALRTHITWMILLETLLISAAAGIVGVASGVLFGVAGAYALMVNEQLYVVTAIPWVYLAALMVSVLAAAALGSVLPARRAAAIPPAAALA